MIRYLAIIGTLLIINPLVPTSSESVPPTVSVSAYETAVDGSALVANSPVKIPAASYRGDNIVYAEVTGYSSTADQTDATPFITASGTYVRQGVVAANWLPIGTKVKLPELFGDQVFTVEDRMHSRFADRLDIWFADRNEAKDFGKQTAKIVVL